MHVLRWLSWLTLLGAAAHGVTSPTPLVYQPLIPLTAKPGSGSFTLTVNGTGFATTALVTWNGSTRITSFISSSQVQAEITAADVANPGTATINVVNPGPGGKSNTVFFPIQLPAPSAAFAAASGFAGSGVSVEGDFNNDGFPDLAVASQDSNGFFVDTYLGNGNGTFQAAFPNHSVIPVASLLTGDFKNHGKLGVIVLDGVTNTAIFPNYGNGVFIQDQAVRSPGDGATIADFNGDGNLDVAASGAYIKVFLGNGRGTVGSPITLDFDCEYNGGCYTPAAGDFNRDGKVDLASPSGGDVYVFLGNGDGTFQKPVYYGTAYGGYSAVTADVNGDGYLDVITNGVSVLLGRGDGTFTSAGGVQISGQRDQSPPVLGDFNGDGKLDVAVSSSTGIWLLLGNGDGTFQKPIQVANDSATTLAFGDFNGDGKIDLVGHSLYMQVSLLLNPTSLNFGNQPVGTNSQPQNVNVLNIGSSALPLSGFSFGGADPNDFSQTNNCGSSLPSEGSCQVAVTFTPQSSGQRSATLNVGYQGFGSPQSVSLTGYGTVLTVALSPTKLSFPTQLVGTSSSPRTATLTNTGNYAVTISNIGTSGAFTQTNNCPSTLPVNGSCQIQVVFSPVQKGLATGTLSVTDNAQGSPQTVALVGYGTIVQLSPVAINFGNQPVGTHSNQAPVTFTNVGKIAVKISSITFVGKDPSDFSQTNNCGNSVPAGGKCTIQVTFTPQAKGGRSASLHVNDNGGGSPQKVALSGNGT